MLAVLHVKIREARSGTTDGGLRIFLQERSNPHEPRRIHLGVNNQSRRESAKKRLYTLTNVLLNERTLRVQEVKLVAEAAPGMEARWNIGSKGRREWT